MGTKEQALKVGSRTIETDQARVTKGNVDTGTSVKQTPAYSAGNNATVSGEPYYI